MEESYWNGFSPCGVGLQILVMPHAAECCTQQQISHTQGITTAGGWDVYLPIEAPRRRRRMDGRPDTGGYRRQSAHSATMCVCLCAELSSAAAVRRASRHCLLDHTAGSSRQQEAAAGSSRQQAGSREAVCSAAADIQCLLYRPLLRTALRVPGTQTCRGWQYFREAGVPRVGIDEFDF